MVVKIIARAGFYHSMPSEWDGIIIGMVLSEWEIEAIDTKLRGIVKRVARLPKSFPSLAMNNKHFYGLMSFKIRHDSMHIARVKEDMNDTGELGRITRIRLANIQQARKLPHHIYDQPSAETGRGTKMGEDYLAAVGSILHRIGMRIETDCKIGRVEGGREPIVKFADNLAMAKKWRKSMNGYTVLYIEEILTDNRETMVEWGVFARTILGRAGKQIGKAPSWYIELRERIINNGQVISTFKGKPLNLERRQTILTQSSALGVVTGCPSRGDFIATFARNASINMGRVTKITRLSVDNSRAIVEWEH